MDRPLLTAREAAQIIFPGLPARVGQRRVYRWATERIIPDTILLRAGRALYLRRAAFETWLLGRTNGGET